ncbi:cytochrome P450 [Pisolithus marmoratus]|nr:cytochrome P450 [Pisolithus marmoratus]
MDGASTLVRIYKTFQALVRSASVIDLAAGLAAIWALRTAIQAIRKKFRTTKLRGPKSSSLLFGVGKELFRSPDTGAMLEAWSKEYEIHGHTWAFRDTKHPKHGRCVAMFTAMIPSFLDPQIGKGLIWAEGESHRRQRRSIGPSFNSTAIRKSIPAIHKTVDKVKVAWEASIDANGGRSVVLDVQKWMNFVSLDSFGIAGFSYNFGSLDGKPNAMISVLDTFGAPSSLNFWDNSVFLLSLVFPIVLNVPTSRGKILAKLRARLSEICDIIIDEAVKEKERASDDKTSTINLLLKAEDEDSSQPILEQMRILFIASYETTSITMTWALLELARHPDIQTKLREELLSFGGEPSYDQLVTGFPYLDAIVQETLRIHPAAPDLIRQADEDDVIPLSEPVQTKSGEVVDSIAVERGTVIGISISCINCSEAIWGPDAKIFRPERWLEADGVTRRAQEVKGYRHLLTFGDGPRSCIGKLFAIAEIKMLLAVLVKNFVLEMRDGPDTKVEMVMGIILRPKIAGEDGIKVPLRIRQYKG